MSAEDFHLYSARQLIQGLASGQWSSETLTRHFLDRIARLNPELHAVHSLNPQALQQAREIDERRRQGVALGPLAGLPMTLKDAFTCRGLRTTFGTALYAWNRPGKDCRVIAALRAADPVFLGRSAVPTASFDWNCRNQVFPECVNPLDPERTPGGSSGGAAAALAAGITPLELGSDVAGSIRYPAHCCGVYGLRTTDGWLPISDVGPDRKHGFQNLVVCGPMARHLDDLSLITELFAKKFPDPRLKPQAQTKSAQDLRMAFSFELVGLAPDPESRALMQNWLEKLQQRGVQLSEAAPDLDFAGLNADWGLILGYELAHSLPGFLPVSLRKQLMDLMVLKRLGPGWMRPGVLEGMSLKKPDYLAALARYRSTQNQSDRFFKAYDAWVLPTSPSAAIRRAECGSTLQTHLGPIPYVDYLGGYLCSTTMMGTPALAIPIGRTAAGLPIGLQVHGARFADLALLAQMKQLLA